MKKIFITILAISSFLVGCGTEMLKRSPSVAPLLNAYMKNNKLLKKRRQQILLQGINRLEITKSPKDASFLVSVDLNQALLSVVIDQIIQKTSISYSMRDNLLRGRVSARFENLPLLDALNTLLGPKYYHAEMQRNLLMIDDGAPPTGGEKASQDTEAATGSVSVDLPLLYAREDDIIQFLTSIFPTDDNDTKPLRFGGSPLANTVFVAGPPDKVKQAARMVRELDSLRPHVLIEILVVEYSRNDFDRLSMDIKGIQKGNVTDTATNFGSLLSRGGIFTYGEDNDNPTGFTALIDFLLSTERARLISRPYLSTVSGEQASLRISRDRNLVIQEVDSGAAVSSVEEISAGFELDITPTVLSGNQIRVEITIEDSDFVPTLRNVASEKDTKHAETVMQVMDGQSIIIGGFTTDRFTKSLSGVHGLRKIPGLNLLFGDQGRTAQQREIVFFVVPYIWTPGLQSHMPLRYSPLTGMDGQIDIGEPELNPELDKELFKKE